MAGALFLTKFERTCIIPIFFDKKNLRKIETQETIKWY